MECWQVRFEEVGGIGVKLRYKYDHKLFRRYTRNVVERKVTGCFFAIMVLSMQQQDQVLREILENIRQCER